MTATATAPAAAPTAAKQEKPAKPAKPRRYYINRYTSKYLNAIADALGLPNNSELGMQALDAARGDPAQAAAAIVKQLADAGIILWDRRLGCEPRPDQVLGQITGTLRHGIRTLFLHIFFTRPESDLAEAALATNRLEPFVVWCMIRNYTDMQDAYDQEPGNPERALTLTRIRAQAVGACLDALNAHFAGFIADPAAEPPRDGPSPYRYWSGF